MDGLIFHKLARKVLEKGKVSMARTYENEQPCWLGEVAFIVNLTQHRLDSLEKRYSWGDVSMGFVMSAKDCLSLANWLGISPQWVAPFPRQGFLNWIRVKLAGRKETDITGALFSSQLVAVNVMWPAASSCLDFPSMMAWPEIVKPFLPWTVFGESVLS